MSNQPTVVILDSHQLFSFGLQALFQAFGAEFSSLVVNDLEEALEKLVRKQSIKLAIIDLSAQGVAGPTTIKMLRSRFPELKILAVSTSPSRDIIFECLIQGAYGCVLKTQSGADILNAIRVVLSGGIYLPASVADAAANGADISVPNAHIPITVKENIGTISTGAGAATNVRMSRQQQAVLRLLTRGLSNKAIARELQLAEGTVKVHINGVFKALNVNSRVQAVIRSAEYHRDDRPINLDFPVSDGNQTSEPDIQFTLN